MVMSYPRVVARLPRRTTSATALEPVTSELPGYHRGGDTKMPAERPHRPSGRAVDRNLDEDVIPLRQTR